MINYLKICMTEFVFEFYILEFYGISGSLVLALAILKISVYRILCKSIYSYYLNF